MYANILNHEVAYTDKGDGEVIVLLHGWGCSKEIFDELIERYSSKYRVITVDLPGFGESEEPNDFVGSNFYVNILEGLLSDLSVKNPILVGHSFGGKVAMLYASKYDVSKLILIDSAGIKPFRGLIYYIKIGIYKGLKKVGIRLNTGSKDYKSASNKMKGILSKVVNENILKDIKDVKCETLLIWGEYDITTPIEDAYKISNYISDSAVVKIPKAYHYPFIENKEYFNIVLDKYLSGEDID